MTNMHIYVPSSQIKNYLHFDDNLIRLYHDADTMQPFSIIHGKITYTNSYSI